MSENNNLSGFIHRNEVFDGDTGWSDIHQLTEFVVNKTNYKYVLFESDVYHIDANNNVILTNKTIVDCEPSDRPVSMADIKDAEHMSVFLLVLGILLTPVLIGIVFIYLYIDIKNNTIAELKERYHNENTEKEQDRIG